MPVILFRGTKVLTLPALLLWIAGRKFAIVMLFSKWIFSEFALCLSLEPVCKSDKQIGGVLSYLNSINE